MIENPMVSGLGAHYARTERHDTLVELAHTALVVEFLGAAQANPLKVISTPGFGDSVGGRREMPMVDVLADQLSGVGGEAKWAELVTILSKSLAGMRWLRERAEEHAKFHELDAVEGEE